VRHFGLLAIVGLTALFLSGCAGNLPPQQIPLVQKEAKELTVAAIDTDGMALTKEQIFASLGTQMGKSSFYTQKKWQNSSSAGLSYVYGVESKYNNQNLILEYVNGQDYHNTTGLRLAKDTFKFPVNGIFDASINKFKIRVIFPSSYDSSEGKNTLGMSFEHLDAPQAIQQDSQRLFNNLVNLKISRASKVNGEINTKYNDASTYANFERIMGIYDWRYTNKPTNTDITKEKYFSYKMQDGQSLPLNVKVYPYQNGSKVVYTMEIPYYLDMQGGVSLSKKDIEAIKKQIEKIAND